MTRVLKALILGIAGWLIFSVLAILPRNMSLPVPKWMQSYHSNLFFTGHTYRNELIRLRSEQVIAPGTFSSMGLFENHNLASGGYFHEAESLLYFRSGNAGDSIHPETMESRRISEDEGCTIIPIDGCEVALRTDTVPRLFHKGTFLKDKSWMSQFLTYQESSKKSVSDNNKIIDLLVRSETEYITRHQLMSLLQFAYVGRIRGWYPEEQIAIFGALDSEDREILYRYHTDRKTESGYEYERYGPYSYEETAVISSHELLTYDKDNTILLTGEETPRVSAECEVSQLQFMYDEYGNLIIGGTTAQNTIFLEYTDHPGIVSYKPREGFQCTYLYLTPQYMILISMEPDSHYSFKTVQLKDLKELET